MKRMFLKAFGFLLLTLGLTGCSSVGEKSGNVSLIYGITATLSFLLLVGCFLFVQKRRFWVLTLFSSVFVVNLGYTFLSVSSCLNAALWANRISYLGSVFLPFTMLMIILNVTNTPSKKQLPYMLFGISVLMFLIAASPGILPIYYKEVSYVVVNGVSSLVKVYGPLHPLYLVYLLCYFLAMVAVIIRAQIKKTISSSHHAIILATAVFVNIGVWFIEQIVKIDFEVLSISYIISELFLLGVHMVMNETQRLREMVVKIESAKNYYEEDPSLSQMMLEKPIDNKTFASERVELFISGFKTLTPTEKSICDAYIARVTTKEIMANMNIKESTLKYHNRNIYGKLGVSSRKELLELHKHIKSVKSKINATENSSLN